MKTILIALATMLFVVACSEEAPVPRVVDVIVDDARLEPYRPKSEYVGRLQAADDRSLDVVDFIDRRN